MPLRAARRRPRRHRPHRARHGAEPLSGGGPVRAAAGGEDQLRRARSRRRAVRQRLGRTHPHRRAGLLQSGRYGDVALAVVRLFRHGGPLRPRPLRRRAADR
ncbi:hypothetical protein G6F65_022795 [Rhizopus arrhizus]|nr:hypothetical protein G6F23_013874 [Rhizopus arrhizus]KAG1242839.1 hypothetical protein G6F65_022795 [Rhizopus arrhizus]